MQGMTCWLGWHRRFFDMQESFIVWMESGNASEETEYYGRKCWSGNDKFMQEQETLGCFAPWIWYCKRHAHDGLRAWQIVCKANVNLLWSDDYSHGIVLKLTSTVYRTLVNTVGGGGKDRFENSMECNVCLELRPFNGTSMYSIQVL